MCTRTATTYTQDRATSPGLQVGAFTNIALTQRFKLKFWRIWNLWQGLTRFICVCLQSIL